VLGRCFYKYFRHIDELKDMPGLNLDLNKRWSKEKIIESVKNIKKEYGNLCKGQFFYLTWKKKMFSYSLINVTKHLKPLGVFKNGSKWISA
jgi:hypothetical protein